MSLTPERCVVFVAATLGLLPLALASSGLLRCGGTAAAATGAVAGRVLVLLVLILGVRLGLLSGGVMFVVPSLLGIAVFVEVFAAPVYAASRNLVAIAVVDAAWLAFVVAAIMPMRV
jgi:hypothetical protein